MLGPRGLKRRDYMGGATLSKNASSETELIVLTKALELRKTRDTESWYGFATAMSMGLFTGKSPSAGRGKDYQNQGALPLPTKGSVGPRLAITHCLRHQRGKDPVSAGNYGAG